MAFKRDTFKTATGWIIEVDQVELIVDEAMFEPPSSGQPGGLGVGDLDGNGVIDGTDLTLLLGQWDQEDQAGEPSGDGGGEAGGEDADPGEGAGEPDGG